MGEKGQSAKGSGDGGRGKAASQQQQQQQGVGPLLVCAALCGVSLGVGTYFWNRLKRTSPRFSRLSSKTNWTFVMTKTHVDLLRKYKAKCAVSADQLNRITEDFIAQMQSGLGEDGGMLKMLPSYVEKMPTGREQGEFLAIDLGGTNVRVVKVLLQGGKVKDVVAHEDAIPPAMMRGTTKELFDFIAKMVQTFIATHAKAEAGAQNGAGESGQPIPIGFTFSYPMKQTGIRRGELICWTKGFDIKDTLGKDLVELLEASLEEQGVNGKVFAILNDTVGTLAASKFCDQDTQLGVILGTGSNAAYIEGASRISKLKEKEAAGAGGEGKRKMIINIEWGNYNSSHLPYLDEDRAIDAQSLNAGVQHYEKMISGMYLGEMVRRICLRASKEINLFGGTQRKFLETAWSFPTSLVSKIDGCAGTGDLDQVEKLLAGTLKIDPSSVSESDARFVAELCALIGKRSAALAAAGVVAIYKYLVQVRSAALPTHSSLH